MLKLKPNTFATWYKEPTHWKRPNAGKDWRQKEKGMAEDEIVKYHHWLNGHESEQTLGDSEVYRCLTCYSKWGCKELRHDLATEQQQLQ